MEAFQAYNATALRCGLRQATKLTPGRAKGISARLREFGADGWATALANIEKSKFLCGETEQGFRADLDFVIQAKSFAKLHDGGYGNGRHVKLAANALPDQPILTREQSQASAKAEMQALLAQAMGAVQ